MILDIDLADLYGVPTKVLNQAVRRNSARFPKDFMFRLTRTEKTKVVTNCDHLERLKYSPVPPAVFTEHGAIMAATVLNTPRAVEMSVFVVRAFVGLRALLATHKELAAKLAELEQKLSIHDEQILTLFEAIKQPTIPQALPAQKRIGFRNEEDE